MTRIFQTYHLRLLQWVHRVYINIWSFRAKYYYTRVRIFLNLSFLCLSQDGTWISNIICRGVFCVQWVEVRCDCVFSYICGMCWQSLFKKSLKIPKGWSESVNRRTDNTMAKKKKYKRTNNDLLNTTHKTKDRVTRTPLKTGVELRCSGRVCSFCSTSGTRRVNLVKACALECTYCAVGIRSLSHVTYEWCFRTDRSRDDTGYSMTVVSVPVWFSRQRVIIFYLW